MEILVHIPACQEQAFYETPVSATRLAYTNRPLTTIGVRIPTPAFLREMGPAFQLARVGKAVLETLNENPCLRVSLVNGKFIQAVGTTILITGRDKANENTVVATWDFGENYLTAFRRLNEARKIFTLSPLVAAEYLLSALKPNLPPPQCLISNVMELSECEPDMGLGGCSANCPIAMAIGHEKINITFDHRIFDWNPHEITFVKVIRKHLEVQ